MMSLSSKVSVLVSSGLRCVVQHSLSTGRLSVRYPAASLSHRFLVGDRLTGSGVYTRSTAVYKDNPAVFPCLETCSSSSQKCFHTSARRNIPPMVFVVLKPLAKVASLLTGRRLRIWWRTLSDQQRQYWRKRFFEYKYLWLAGSVLLIGVGSAHYFTHIKETPVTKRHRYIAFTDNQFKELAEFEYQVQLENVKEKIVSPEHPVYKRVTNVVQRIVTSNQDLNFLRQQTWTIIVVENEEMNAFVLPTGHIFVFTGLLRMVENDSQLAVVIGHEMAHALLSHAAEQVSFATIIDVLIIITMAAIWAVMPTDGIAIVTEWFYNKVIQIMLHLPYNRKLEEEADVVGLHLIAKACFDVRESSVFWHKMDLQKQLADEGNGTDVELPQWLSTHPTNATRADHLDLLVPAAVDLRRQCNCPKLPDRDPKSTVAYMRQLVAEKKLMQEQKSGKPSVVMMAIPPGVKAKTG